MAITKALQKLDNDFPEYTCLKDRTNPRSVINLVANEVGKVIENLPEEMTGLDESELKKIIAVKKEKLLPTDHRLRVSFWKEYSRAQIEKDKIYSIKVYSGICSREYWEKYILTNPSKVAWITCPPVNFTKALDECLLLGINELRAILEVPNLNRAGFIDPKILDAKLRALMFIDAKLHGSIVQKVETKNLNVNVETQVPEEKKMSVEELDAKIHELTKKLNDRMDESQRREKGIKEVKADVVSSQDGVVVLAAEDTT